MLRTNKKKLNNLRSAIMFDLKMWLIIFNKICLGLYFVCCGIQQIYCMLHLSYNTFGFNPTVISSKRRKKKSTLRSKKSSMHPKNCVFLPRVSSVVWTTFRRCDQRVGIVSHWGEADSCHSSPLWCLSALAESFSGSCGSQCYNDDQRWQMYS